MNVSIRSSSAQLRPRRHRQYADPRRARRDSDSASARGSVSAVPSVPAVPSERRRGPAPLQDRALYTCGCGFVFDAAVTTSVSCPHCGDLQAW